MCELFEDYPARYSADVSAATAGFAATGRSLRWLLPRVARLWQARAQSAVGAVALEDLRQPAAQFSAGGRHAFIAARLEPPIAPLAVDLHGSRHSHRAFHPHIRYLKPSAAPTIFCGASTWPPLRALPAAASRRPASALPVCLTKPSSAWTPSCARCGAWRSLANACSNGRPRQRKPRGTLLASLQAMWIAPAIATTAYIYLANQRPTVLLPPSCYLACGFSRPSWPG